jgi:hypothetical protein|tara:strand:- start:291 stop:512 length:222 start_codon:yes stop_codon:yes gene_type:complete
MVPFLNVTSYVPRRWKKISFMTEDCGFHRVKINCPIDRTFYSTGFSPSVLSLITPIRDRGLVEEVESRSLKRI